jgi:hypothetical protein
MLDLHRRADMHRDGQISVKLRAFGVEVDDVDCRMRINPVPMMAPSTRTRYSCHWFATGKSKRTSVGRAVVRFPPGHKNVRLLPGLGIKAIEVIEGVAGMRMDFSKEAGRLTRPPLKRLYVSKLGLGGKRVVYRTSRPAERTPIVKTARGSRRRHSSH